MCYCSERVTSASPWPLLLSSLDQHREFLPRRRAAANQVRDDLTAAP